jgi:membrane dipeptidase
MLDLAHCSDQSLIEAAERFEGVLMCTHANPRALLKRPRYPERHLSDTAIRLIAERDGVIGIMPCNRFLKSDWVSSAGKAAVPLDLVAAAIDHVCQLTGSVAHVGLGTDFDGGFGAESTPDGIDTIADLPRLIPLLTARGYSREQVTAMLADNWLRVLRKGLP